MLARRFTALDRSFTALDGWSIEDTVSQILDAGVTWRGRCWSIGPDSACSAPALTRTAPGGPFTKPGNTLSPPTSRTIAAG